MSCMLDSLKDVKRAYRGMITRLIEGDTGSLDFRPCRRIAFLEVMWLAGFQTAAGSQKTVPRSSLAERRGLTGVYVK